MIPIDIQVSRSKVKVKGQAYSLHVGEGGAFAFNKQLYLIVCFHPRTGSVFIIKPFKKNFITAEENQIHA